MFNHARARLILRGGNDMPEQNDNLIGPAPKFGIGEWFGKSVIKMSGAELRETAAIALKHKPPSKNPPRLADRPKALEAFKAAPRCPFMRMSETEFLPCNKQGGVCSIRMFSANSDGSATVVPPPKGNLVTLCPNRFHQDDIGYGWVADKFFGLKESPQKIGQVRFLRRKKRPTTEVADDAKEEDREDVGNIDMVLVNPKAPFLDWCPLEIQAVYFSGDDMSVEYRHIIEWKGKGIPFPTGSRRPDYRSSGPKRLMPQLQIKIPTLRRWGKKMAVVIDEQFFGSLGEMVPLDDPNDVSNCDMGWFVLRFNEETNPVKLEPWKCHLTTLERAVEGLTNGFPVSLPAFEEKIRSKLEELKKVKPHWTVKAMKDSAQSKARPSEHGGYSSSPPPQP